MNLQIVLQTPPEDQKSTDITYVLPNDINAVENGVCKSIEMFNALDFIPNRQQFLLVCLNKLRPGGQLSFSGLDLLECCKNIVNGRILIDQASSLLYGGKQSIDNIHRLTMFFQQNNFTILEKRLQGITYYIKVAR